MDQIRMPGPDTTGLVYNIQRYNLHDGPGIRTIIFLKGCPLHCPWCANPESQSCLPESMDGETVGYEISAGEAVDRASRDLPFFRRSAGGITISGGEVTAQPDFALAIELEAKRRGIHVTLETACCTDYEIFRRVAAPADVILADIKQMDDARHLAVLGMSNQVILDNIRRSASEKKQIIIRVPVIPGFNSDQKNLRETAAFCKTAGIGEINLLPYHEMGVGKYKKLGRPYTLQAIHPPAKAVLLEQAGKLEQEFGIVIKVL